MNDSSGLLKTIDDVVSDVTPRQKPRRQNFLSKSSGNACCEERFSFNLRMKRPDAMYLWAEASFATQ